MKRIAALPVVEYDELNTIFNYDDSMSYRPSDRGHGQAMNFTVGLDKSEDGTYLVDVPDYSGKYKPVDGMIEILESEYLKLSQKYEDSTAA